MRLTRRWLSAVLLPAAMLLLFACGIPGTGPSAPPANSSNQADEPSSGQTNEPSGSQADAPDDGKSPGAQQPDEPSGGAADEPSGGQADSPDSGDSSDGQPSDMPSGGAANDGSAGGEDAMEVIADAAAVTVLVNKHFMLPDDYKPDNLVYPDVRFTFDEKIEKRMMRADAAAALEELFAAADEDGLPLAGVSAYRSHERQKQLFESYVKRDGEEKARTYSAYPGTSEHETGLAIDVAGSDGSCAATDCFGDKPEAAWLAGHAHEYGFIIRYPQGKEDITGYKYEPWHLRYVGKDVAADIYERGITLEEYAAAEVVSGRADH